jgi:arylsulfatase A-like enzyme
MRAGIPSRKLPSWTDHMNKIDRRLLIKTAAATVLSSLASGTPAAQRGRPNVLLVICDEWRAQAFRYRGDTNAPTTALDRFAGESLDFQESVSCTPICCPSRASLLTGQYSLTNGVYINDVSLKPTGTTLGEAFAATGYTTGYIGKWHLYGSPAGRYERRLSYIPPDRRFGFQYWKVAECTHDYMHSLYYEAENPTPKYWDGYDAIAQTSDADQYIRDHANADRPYFLTVSYGPPHFPYMAPPEYKARWSEQDIRLRPNVPEKEHDEAVKELRGYYAAIAVLDDCFSRLMQTLEASGTAQDTIVVFMSDHGEMGYSHGLKYKDVPWEESIRIPLMVRYPRKYGRAGRRCGVPLCMPDVMPTLLGFAGIAKPEGVEGYDWSQTLDRQPNSAAPRSTFLCMPASTGSMRSDGFAEYRGVRTTRYTYVRSIKGPWLLYDNQADPYQLENLIDEPGLKNVRAELEAELGDWLQRRKDEFLPGIRYLERDHLTHYLEARLPIHPTPGPDGQWQPTLFEGDANVLPSDPDALKLLRQSLASGH